MQLRALWRSLIAVAAIVFLFGGPTQAQTAAATTQASAGKPLALGKYVKHRSRHARKTATRHSRHSVKKTAKKSSTSQRSAKAKNTDNSAKDNNNDAKDRAKTASVRKAAEELSAVADARAELKADDRQTRSAAINSPIANAFDGINAARPIVSAPDTRSDLDKVEAAAAALDTPIAASAITAPMKVVSTAPAPEASVPTASSQIVSNHDDVGDTWDRTSLIGKIFVAFGGLLTLASAARMFMA